MVKLLMRDAHSLQQSISGRGGVLLLLILMLRACRPTEIWRRCDDSIPAVAAAAVPCLVK